MKGWRRSRAPRGCSPRGWRGRRDPSGLDHRPPGQRLPSPLPGSCRGPCWEQTLAAGWRAPTVKHRGHGAPGSLVLGAAGVRPAWARRPAVSSGLAADWWAERLRSQAEWRVPEGTRVQFGLVPQCWEGRAGGLLARRPAVLTLPPRRGGPGVLREPPAHHLAERGLPGGPGGGLPGRQRLPAPAVPAPLPVGPAEQAQSRRRGLPAPGP